MAKLMFKRLFLALTLCASTIGLTACDGGGGGGGMTVPSRMLKPGGIFVAFNNGCTGCERIGFGDLIQEVDGKAVNTTAEMDAITLTDGQPHKLKVYKQNSKEVIDLEITAQPNNSLPPLKDAPPFFYVGANELDAAPGSWARRRHFGHVSPQIQLVNADGGIINGRDFYGKKHFVVFWDWQTQQQQADAAVFFRVMQKAQADLKAKGIDMVFAHVTLPGQARKPAANDTDIRNFAASQQVKEKDGGPFPFPPLYRYPNATEFNEAQSLGLEGARTYLEGIGASPAILIIDDHGVVRWHSEGTVPDPEQKLEADQYTIIKSVKWAQENL